ncbi:MAG: hypothetical protein VB015_01685 [Erysipelotrichaceae bacterium]|nr:hypothetical protein [Erysipelotrichaceae bacterium]
MDFINWMDKNPHWLKLVFCLGPLDILWSIYRIIKAVKADNSTQLIVAIVFLIIGAPVIWLFDLIYVLINKKIWWF